MRSARAGRNPRPRLLSPSSTLHLPALISAMSGVLVQRILRTQLEFGDRLASRGRACTGTSPSSARMSESFGASAIARWKFCSAFAALAEHRVDEAVDVVDPRVSWDRASSPRRAPRARRPSARARSSRRRDRCGSPRAAAALLSCLLDRRRLGRRRRLAPSTRASTRTRRRECNRPGGPADSSGRFDAR